MECSVEKNKTQCSCTYPCSNHGHCCNCIKYHRQNGELPACYFSAAAEKTYDRSIEAFIKDYNGR